LNFLYRRYFLRDPFLREIDRWFNDKGDETLRLTYPLTAESIVFDLGGYHGDFAAAVNSRYGCKVYVFEPVPEFYKRCVDRFHGNSKIACFNFGLSSADGMLDIGLVENSSSFSSPHAQGVMLQVHVRSIVEYIRELGVARIDLMKINIEGSEFDILPAIIKSGDIDKVQHLQIQFHNFVDCAVEQRDTIRSVLNHTHAEMWNYDFVWESWRRKEV
jgi:FkbM family methyltransferase